MYGIKHNHEKRENKCVAKNKINCTSGVCEKDAIDWASNDIETQLQLKVAKITQEIMVPFKNGIPRWGWL